MIRLRLVSTVSLPLVMMMTTVSVLAQPARPGPAEGIRIEPQGEAPASRPVTTEQDKLRLQIAAMEGVLATAVHEIHGRQLEKMMPGLMTFDGGIRARGFQLEGYGVFFDVDLPPLPRSVAWTFQVLDRPVPLDLELAQLRRQVAAVNDPRLRGEFEQTLRTIQRKVSRSGPATVTRQSGVQGDPSNEAEERMVQASRATEAPAADPFASYEADLGHALADIMVHYGGTITLRPDDWLTIAARESQPRLLPGGPVQAAITLRIKGADLAAFKAGRLTAEEARKKVDIKEF
ncbi:MAG TPA: hypothetical protein VK911_18025 [Vicinamibacterales bacterium]|nr:hypothetical protein [Vicinamibacterales bacterium]